MKKIPLTQGYFALVDDEDASILKQYKWCVSVKVTGAYAVRRVTVSSKKYRMVYMHRLLIGLNHGDKKQADHINGDTLDNRKCNLRVCNHRQNQQNSKSTRHSSSKYKGVTWCKNNNKWHAKISMHGKTIHLGCFSSEEDAARMYDKVALAEFKKFAKTNFLQKNYSYCDIISVDQLLKQRRTKNV